MSIINLSFKDIPSVYHIFFKVKYFLHKVMRFEFLIVNFRFQFFYFYLSHN